MKCRILLLVCCIYSSISYASTTLSCLPGSSIYQVLQHSCNLLQDLESGATTLLAQKAQWLEQKVSTALCDPVIIDEVPYTITQSGTYLLAQDFTYTIGFLETGYIDYIITISADDVILDFCGHTISGDEDVLGILIEHGKHNIEIKNGALSGVDYPAATNLAYGIVVSPGVSYLYIHDFAIKTTSFGILLQNLFAASDNTEISYVTLENIFFNTSSVSIYNPSSMQELHGIVVENCTIDRGTISLQRADTVFIKDMAIQDGGIGIQNGSHVYVQDVTLSAKTNVGGALSLIQSSGCLVDNVTIYDHIAGSIILSDSHDCIVRNAIVESTHTESIIFCINLSSSSNCSILDAVMRNNSAQTLIGIFLNNAFNCYVAHCQIVDNEATGNSFFGIICQNSNAKNNVIEDCVVMNNDAPDSFTNGAFVTTINTSQNVFLRCIALHNAGYGFLGRNNVFFQECQAFYNSVGGFNLANPINTALLFKNSACHNGPYGDDNFIDANSDTVIGSIESARGFQNVDCESSALDELPLAVSKLCDLDMRIDSSLSIIDEILNNIQP